MNRRKRAGHHPSQRECRLSRRLDPLITACTTLPGTTRKTMPNAEYRATSKTSGMRADPGEVEGAGGATASLDSANLHGTELSGTWFVNRNTGVEVSFGYNRGSISLSGLTLPDLGIDLRSADVTQYTFLVGPRYRVVSTRRHHVDVRALFGGASLNFDVPVSVSTFKSEEFGFAATFGGSYTLVLNDVFSFRVIQPDVLISTAGSTRTNFRLSTGIVFRYQ